MKLISSNPIHELLSLNIVSNNNKIECWKYIHKLKEKLHFKHEPVAMQMQLVKTEDAALYQLNLLMDLMPSDIRVMRYISPDFKDTNTRSSSIITACVVLSIPYSSN